MPLIFPFLFFALSLCLGSKTKRGKTFFSIITLAIYLYLKRYSLSFLYTLFSWFFCAICVHQTLWILNNERKLVCFSKPHKKRFLLTSHFECKKMESWQKGIFKTKQIAELFFCFYIPTKNKLWVYVFEKIHAIKYFFHFIS